MAQVAIPFLLMGTAYLISNNNDDEYQEGYSELKENDDTIIDSDNVSKMFMNESKELSSKNSNYVSNDEMMARPGGDKYIPILSKTENSKELLQNSSCDFSVSKNSKNLSAFSLFGENLKIPAPDIFI